MSVVHDVVADASHDRATNAAETASSSHYRYRRFMLRYVADQLAWVVAELRPHRPAYLTMYTVRHNYRTPWL